MTVVTAEDVPQKEDLGFWEQKVENREHSLIPGISKHNLDKVSKRGQSETPVWGEGGGQVLQSDIMGISLQIKYIALEAFLAVGIEEISEVNDVAPIPFGQDWSPAKSESHILANN